MPEKGTSLWWVTRRSIPTLALALALAGLGSLALAAGWEAPAAPVAQGAAQPGLWTLSVSGVLTWTTDGASAPVPASWYLERSKQLADIQADSACQIAACASR